MPAGDQEAAVHFATATPAAARQLAALHTAVALDLTARFGRGSWSRKTSEKGALLALRSGVVRIALLEGVIAGTYALTAKKPWAIDNSYFPPCRKPLYLTSMAVLPEMQRRGIGRLAIADARAVARGWPADAIRLDAYEGDAGAAPFYAKAGLREVAHATYKGTALVYFELALPAGGAGEPVA